MIPAGTRTAGGARRVGACVKRTRIPAPALERPAPLIAHPAAQLGIAVCAALLIGFATAFAQGLLPHALSPLANSSGSWSLAAFLLALLSRRPWVSCLIGVLSLAAMLAGYDIASLVRGYSPSSGQTLFWLAAAATAGPLLGLAGNAVRTRSRFAPAAAGLMGGVLAGEGVYGLLYIADTTPPAYWACSIAAGVALTAWGVLRNSPTLAGVAAALGTAVPITVLFPLAYSPRFLLLFS